MTVNDCLFVSPRSDWVVGQNRGSRLYQGENHACDLVFGSVELSYISNHVYTKLSLLLAHQSFIFYRRGR